jgi:hypothetical protein
MVEDVVDVDGINSFVVEFVVQYKNKEYTKSLVKSFKGSECLHHIFKCVLKQFEALKDANEGCVTCRLVRE